MSYQATNIEEFFHIQATVIVGHPYTKAFVNANVYTQKMYSQQFLETAGLIPDVKYKQYLQICLEASKPKKELRYIN